VYDIARERSIKSAEKRYETMAKTYVYNFKDAKGLGKDILGGKGQGLAEMTSFGVPIPEGFTVTTEACNLYYKQNKQISEEVRKEIFSAIKVVEKQTGKTFGGSKNPLLVSVRSGARVSMPGMMDTILNLGLNDTTVEVLSKETGNERFAYDSYRRFILMFTNIAKNHGRVELDKMLEEAKEKKGVKADTDLDAKDLKALVKRYKDYYKKVFKEEFPADPFVQLIEAITAVFRSWDNPRANIYRKMNNIPYEWGTAVNVQSMVFGNKGETSGTGVAFSRSPSTGEKALFAEYLPNAQGEDVVAGIRTPLSVDYLKKTQPGVYAQFLEIIKTLESNYRDMQDMEFTVEEGKLYFLQTRNGKRTGAAALKIAIDLVKEKVITQREAVLRVDPKSLDTLLHPSFDPKILKTLKAIGEGLPASPGAATGKISFTAEDAAKRAEAGEKVVLVRAETSPEDIEGMVAAQGILTMRGGMTSHAAVVARGMGKCCVAGVSTAQINEEQHYVTFDGGKTKLTSKDTISIDGSTGQVYLGTVGTVEPEMTGYFGTMMEWADQYRTLKVRTNADTPKDATTALKFGAQGIGLCRTEHMFFEKSRIFNVRKMILAETLQAREEALAKLLPEQEADFYELFKTMKDFNTTIRLLDPPLHEFLPQEASKIKELAKDLGLTVEQVENRISFLHEFNPMMGHRGVRLDVSYPEIAVMQTKAIIQAALRVQKDIKKPVTPEIMIPLVLDVKELKYVKDIIVKTADDLIAKSGQKMTYEVGTMIEIPRAALLAESVATEATFFSFGTNDLTQMTYGFSRDDAGKFLPDYYAKKIFEQDPFQTVDTQGVGKLIKMAVQDGRKTRPTLKVGICGEHGGDPLSIDFFHNAGLNYVSCSPYRVPVARLAAAQAAIRAEDRAKKN
jgi:pyruvate,orthophosphate dikinase